VPMRALGFVTTIDTTVMTETKNETPLTPKHERGNTWARRDSNARPLAPEAWYHNRKIRQVVVILRWCARSCRMFLLKLPFVAGVLGEQLGEQPIGGDGCLD
jgi:hypothetical protein